MSINNITPNVGVQSVSGSTNRSSSAETSSGSSQPIDTVTLTDAVAQLIELQDNLAQIPDISNQRVDQIRQALADGNYQVDASRLAQNLIDTQAE